MAEQRRFFSPFLRLLIGKRAAWFVCLAAAWCMGVSPAYCQIALTFDWSQLGNPTLSSGSNIYVVFSGAQSDIVIAQQGGNENIQFGTQTGTSFNWVSVNGTASQVQTEGTWGSAIAYDGFVYSTSKPYSLATLASSTVTINSGTSVKGFLVYGPSDSTTLNSIALRPVLQGGPSPFAAANNAMQFSSPGNYSSGTFALNVTAPRYSEFEFTYSGTGSAGYFDLTNIDQFGGALRMSLLSTTGTQQSSWNTQHAGDQFRSLAGLTASQTWAGGVGNTYPDGNWQSNPLITTGSAGTGEFVRVIGPSKFPNGAPLAGTVAGNTPYGTFNDYLGKLASGTLQATGTLTNQAPGAQPGGTGAVGGFTGQGAFSGTGAANANYYFTPSFTAVSGSAGTTYSVTLSGSVVMVPTSGTVIAATYPLEILIGADQTTVNPPDQPLLMTNFINQIPGIGQGLYTWTDGGLISLTLTSTGANQWQQLDADWAGAASSTIAQKVYGDFAQGMLAGLVGNPTIVSGSTTIGSLTSYEWWQDPLVAYSGTGNMSEWGQYIWNNSLVDRPAGANPIPGGPFEGGVYGSVYDDRWARNTLNSDANTTTLQISLLPDGDLSVVPVPESSSIALASIAAAIGGLAWQRRLRSARRRG